MFVFIIIFVSLASNRRHGGSVRKLFFCLAYSFLLLHFGLRNFADSVPVNLRTPSKRGVLVTLGEDRIFVRSTFLTTKNKISDLAGRPFFRKHGGALTISAVSSCPSVTLGLVFENTSAFY